MKPNGIHRPALLVFLSALLIPAGASAHLFHFAGLEIKETQVARDFRLIKELIEWREKRFDTARQVYRGELRRRASNPAEPGFVLKAGYQRSFPTPPLKVLARSLDKKYGTSIDLWIEARLTARDEEGVKAGFRALFYFHIQEILDALVEHPDRPTVLRQLFGVLTDYLFTAFEIHLALTDRPTYLRVTDSLEHLREALGLTTRPAQKPSEVQRLRAQLLGLLSRTLDRRIVPAALL